MIYYKILFLFCVLCLLLPATVEAGIQLYAQSVCDAYNRANGADGPTTFCTAFEGQNFLTFLWIVIPVKLTYAKGLCFIIGSLFFIFSLSMVLFGSKGFDLSLYEPETDSECDLSKPLCDLSTTGQPGERPAPMSPSRQVF